MRPAEPGIIAVDAEGRVVVVTKSGVTKAALRPNPGGWAEFGYDDGPDQLESEGR